MRKYDVWFCRCGRIHVMPTTNLDWVQEDWEKRSVIQVCTNCGKTMMNYINMNSYGESFLMGVDAPEGIVNSGDNCKVILGKGIKVPLKSSGYADNDTGTFYFNRDQVKETGIDWLPDIKDKFPEMVTVDVERLIREVDDPEVIESIKGYASGINWED